MSAAGGSAAARAAALRGARRGLWRRLLGWLGLDAEQARREAVAARYVIGGEAEQETARLLAPLQWQGWYVLHDRQLRRRRFNLDHVLVSPCGSAVVVLDTKRWHRGYPTHLTGGRVHCGQQDRHDQVEKVAKYAGLVGEALGMPAGSVWPLLVVHGSPIAGGRLEARVPEWAGVVHVLGPDGLVPTLAAAPSGRDPRGAARLAARVEALLPAYAEPSR